MYLRTLLCVGFIALASPLWARVPEPVLIWNNYMPLAPTSGAKLSEVKKRLELPGTYAHCGNYLFTWTPSEAGAEKLIGFATRGAGGEIEDISLLSAKNGRVRILLGAKDARPASKMFSFDEKGRDRGYFISLPPEEFERVKACLGAKAAPDPKSRVSA